MPQRLYLKYFVYNLEEAWSWRAGSIIEWPNRSEYSLIFFSKVEDTFQISGRDCVIVPAIPRSCLDFRLRARDSIQLRNPNGVVLDTYIASIEMLCGPQVSDRMAFLMPANLSKQDVPKGTEIWLIREH